MLSILYQSGFNTEGFPNLEDYLYQTVGSLPCQSLLCLALDSVFEEFPEISAIQTRVYRMLKCHLSIINHSSITQFDDISLSNHNFDRGRRWNPNQQYHNPGYQQQSQFSNPNHYCPPPMGHQYRYPIPYEQYAYPQQQQYQSQMLPAPSQQATNICQLCHSQSHYDYQCQFAGNFMARTQKAFNQGRSYSHQDPNHREWSHGDNDNNDPNGQHFQ